jgi:hypothetical protein
LLVGIGTEAGANPPIACGGASGSVCASGSTRRPLEGCVGVEANLPSGTRGADGTPEATRRPVEGGAKFGVNG